MQDTEISWCDDTINPWWGCEKVSPACTHCYAETLDARFHPAEPHWGTKAPRLLRVEKAIGELERSARRAVKEGRRRRVFIASMADIFEDRPDLVEPRRVFLGTLHDIQQQTGQALIPLLLTKQPEVALEYARANPWPRGAWLGVTVEDQKRADERIPVALQVAALTGCRVFLSMEPLLESVDLTRVVGHDVIIDCLRGWGGAFEPWEPDEGPGPRVSWVVVGGESGHRARPMHPEWARSLRDQCEVAGVPFHFKQWGEWLPQGQRPADCDAPILDQRRIDFTADLYTDRLGKRAAGRLLDGRTHDEVPQ